MTPDEIFKELRIKEASLKHAIAHSVSIYPDGRIVENKALHYLTCEKCKLRELLGLPKEDTDAKTLQ